MKKMIAWVLLLAMLLGTFAGCGGAEQTTEPTAATESTNNAAAAIDYLKAIYKDYGAKTFTDFERPGTLRIAGVPYEVVWTVDAAEDLVKVAAGENGNVVVDVNEQCETETAYNLTATVTDESGNTASHSWNYVLPAVEVVEVVEGEKIVLFNPADAMYVTGTDYLYTSSSGSQKHELVLTANKAEALPLAIQQNDDETISFVADGKYLYCDGTHVMFVEEQGEFTKFVLEPCEGGQLIRCATANYSGKAQYLELYSGYMTCYGYNAEKVGLYAFNLEEAGDAAGTVQDVAPVEEPEDPADLETVTDTAKIMDEAFKLNGGEKLSYNATLTGVITEIVTPFSTKYNNITVNIEVDGYAGKTVQCYRLAGEGADALSLFDVITVTGILTNYKGTIEFAQGCTLDKVVKGDANAVTDAAKVVADLKAQANNEKLPYLVTLTGTVHSILNDYNANLGTMSVAMWVEGTTENIRCLDMIGDDLENVNINDEITVTGIMTRFEGEYRFIPGSKMVGKVDHEMPEPSSDPKKIFKDAEKLWEGATLIYGTTLTGKIIKVNTPYSEKNKNITVTIAVEGYESKPVRCYNLIGNGDETLNEGDVVTVSGAFGLKNGGYALLGGVIQAIPVQTDPPKAPTDPKQIVDEAFALKEGETLGYIATLSGPINSINTAWSDKYQNITVSINVTGSDGTKSLMCYRLAGDGAKDLAVGDVITVSGIIKNYKGTIEFDAGCKLLGVIKGEEKEEEEKPVLTDPGTMAGRLEQAATLANNEYLPYEITVSGPVTKINTAYSEQYKNISFTIEVEGESVYCYRAKGEGMDTLAVGDTVQVTGALTAYNGKPQFGSSAEYVITGKASAEEPTEAPTEEPTEAPTEAPEFEEPAAGPLTVAEAIALAEALGSGVYSENVYTITGTITAIPSDKYGNITVTDETGSFTTYGIDGWKDLAEKPAVGAVVKITGKVGSYGTTPQMKYPAMEVISAAEPPAFEEPAAGPLTVAEAIDLAGKLGSGVYSENVYTITGTITAIPSEQYGNITVTDETGSFTTYGIDGWKDLAEKPAVGAVVKITGKVGSYGTTPQMKYPAMEVIG